MTITFEARKDGVAGCIIAVPEGGMLGLPYISFEELSISEDHEALEIVWGKYHILIAGTDLAILGESLVRQSVFRIGIGDSPCTVSSISIEEIPSD